MVVRRTTSPETPTVWATPGMSRAILSIRARIASVRCTEARVGQLDVDEQIALVLGGDEAGRGRWPRRQPGQPEQAAVDHQHDHAQAQQLPDRPAVGGGDAVEEAVEAPEEPAQHGVHRADEEPAGRRDRPAGRERTWQPQYSHVACRPPAPPRPGAAGRPSAAGQERGAAARRSAARRRCRRSTRAGLLFRLARAVLPAWPCRLLGLKIETAREGVMVMALMAEMIIDAEMVRANWR